jgi:hypothetical protein
MLTLIDLIGLKEVFIFNYFLYYIYIYKMSFQDEYGELLVNDIIYVGGNYAQILEIDYDNDKYGVKYIKRVNIPNCSQKYFQYVYIIDPKTLDDRFEDKIYYIDMYESYKKWNGVPILDYD